MRYLPAVVRTFTCPSCGAKFEWKDSYLNRKVNCRCGCVFEAFEDAQDRVTRVDPYDVFEDDTSSPVAPAGTVLHPATPVTPITPYPTRPTKRTTDEPATGDFTLFRDLILPGALLALGIAIMVGHGLYAAPAEASVARTIALSAVFLSLMILTMVAGGAIAGGLLGVEFGPIGRVVFKFAGTGAFAGAIALVIAGLDQSDSLTGPIVAWNLVFIIYWICFHALFDLDLQENLLSVAVIAVMQAAVGCLLWTI